MALLFIDGFDFYVSADLGTRYNGGSGSMSTPGRSGVTNTQALYLGRDAAMTKLLPGGAKSKVIAGIAARCQVQWEQVWDGILIFQSGGTVQVRIDVDPTTGEVKAYRGPGTALLGTAQSPLRGGAWNHVAAEVTVNSSSGRVRVAVNGVILMDVGTVNTDPAGTGTVDRVSFTAEGTAHTSGNSLFDDFYLADGLGGAGDTLEGYGDVWVGTQYPNSDDSVAWTRSAGTTNYGNVDEAQEDGDTTYNYSSTPSDTDLFGCPAITDPTAGSVVGVQVSAVVRKTEAGTRTFALVLKSGTAESEGAEIGPGTSYQVYSHMVAANPDGGGAWSLETAGAAEVGIRVKT